MYKNMSKLLKDGKVGDFKLEHFEIKNNDLYALLHGIQPGTYVKLTQNNEVIMSNTQMEQHTNIDFVENAHGNVLIGGLGIGMIILAIQEKETVKSITVIEKNKEVIELIQQQLPLNEKVKVINDDVFNYKPVQKFNTIYMDIWNYINEDVYENEMKPLMKYYRKYLISKTEDENRYIDCWCKKQAKNGERI